MPEHIVSPFLKWPGGKRWFVSRYAHLLPSPYHVYIEPFLGAGSVFFRLLPTKAVLGDCNEELINTYVAIRDHCKEFVGLLMDHQTAHSPQHYYQTRDTLPETPIARAARFVYLNRTCFNGIYRVNRRGEFNVPKGSRDTVLRRTDNFQAISAVLRDAEIRVSDFEALVDLAECGDLVFADPPYSVTHNNNSFVKYNERLFSWDDQIRLADALARARDRGAMIVCTNAQHESVDTLYRERGFPRIVPVSRYSSMSASASSRRQFGEVVVLAD